MKTAYDKMVMAQPTFQSARRSFLRASMTPKQVTNYVTTEVDSGTQIIDAKVQVEIIVPLRMSLSTFVTATNQRNTTREYLDKLRAENDELVKQIHLAETETNTNDRASYYQAQQNDAQVFYQRYILLVMYMLLAAAFVVIALMKNRQALWFVPALIALPYAVMKWG